ncbi:hypothetical protein FXN65_10565 [Metapseudomonas lalkuanensis]|uniref:Uncharacterized protein n=1 Tax=Metapseudomonas lalkuanensis TaxID=2604832 RepID=A0A5J6QNU4_9GAMM|nr:hypothetical protein [Pseudomonas lalkuanensis]QEY62496.1 hypothetical protein FXN65_10565 [Pseudomonas lalkuanensis]
MDRAQRHSAMVDFMQYSKRETVVLEEDHEKVEQELARVTAQRDAIPEGCVMVPREVLERALQDCMFLPLEETVRRNIERNAAVRELRAILAQQGKEAGS